MKLLSPIKIGCLEFNAQKRFRITSEFKEVFAKQKATSRPEDLRSKPQSNF